MFSMQHAICTGIVSFTLPQLKINFVLNVTRETANFLLIIFYLMVTTLS